MQGANDNLIHENRVYEQRKVLIISGNVAIRDI